MSQEVVLIIGVYSLANGILAMVVAEEKGHAFGWIFAGFFLGIIGLIAVVGLPDRRGSHKREGIKTRQCPDCTETVSEAAKVCRFCGYRFHPSA